MQEPIIQGLAGFGAVSGSWLALRMLWGIGSRISDARQAKHDAALNALEDLQSEIEELKARLDTPALPPPERPGDA
jgi:hypothetical protein